MPIDPQTGLDPETGMVGLKETRQPTGAIGAVMSYLNADKSRQISEALQQHRAASAQMEQQQADEYQARQARDDQIRKAIAALGPDANPEQLRMAFLQNGGDYKDVAPQYRAEISAGAKLGSTEIKARAEKYKVFGALGIPLDELDRRFGAPDPDDMELIHRLAGVGNAPPPSTASAPAPEQPKPGIPFLGPEQGPTAPTVGSVPAPLVGAKIEKLGTASDLDRTRGKSIEAKTPAEVDALKAKVTTDRILAQAAKDRASRPGGTHQRSTTLAMEGQIARLGKYISDAMNTTDPYTFKKGPADMTEVNKWKAQQARLEAELAAADEGDDDEELPPAKKAASAVAKPGAPKGSPSPFGDTFSSFLKPAGGASSPNPVDPIGLLK